MQTKMQTKKQSGFTLIELMIVVAIVGILAAVAIPAYQDYIKRSKVSEIAATLAACKTSVSEAYATNGNDLASIDMTASGCSNTGSQYVASLNVEQGVITATAAATGIGTGVDGLTLVLTPNEVGNNINGWTCSGTIQPQFKPANCRN